MMINKRGNVIYENADMCGWLLCETLNLKLLIFYLF